MSFIKEENMEQDDKVNIEEVSVNLAFVKKELNEEELQFEENQKIALNFESSIEQRSNNDSFIGSLDDDVIMEMITGSVKLEDVKEENKDLIRRTMEQSHCNKCGGNYEGYCLKCSSLSHILNNLTPNLKLELVLNTTPINMLEIREVSRRRAVFALKALPKGIILGPFEGITPIESTTGFQWKIKDRKFVNDQNGNWMKYIESVGNHASKNLAVFQFDGILYFETSRDIQGGEELLVCYREEDELKSDKEEEFYLVPVKKEENPKVFACTLCCLGFRLKNCLVEHKSKCSQRDHADSIGDFEIIQCLYCKVWLKKQEHLESHMMHCFENYNRLCHNIPGVPRRPAGEIDESQGNGEISTPIDENRSYLTQTDVIRSKYSCQKTREADDLNAQNIKPFECDICKMRFTQKTNMNTHIRNQHSNISKKEYKCSECSYQTNRKDSAKAHLNAHNDIKPFECHICKKRFTHKSNLKLHTKNEHSNVNEKDYKCSKCSYQTNRKNSFRQHVNTHDDIKPFECDICKKGFTQNSNLKQHLIAVHSNTSEKEYKCTKCSYQTNRKNYLKLHLNTHDDIKPFDCHICKKTFSRKTCLKLHIENQHSNKSEKEYKCTECIYQTYRKDNFKAHLDAHNDIKPFGCDMCTKKFSYKSGLKLHIENKHTIISEKEHKCSECSYQTNRKDCLKRHLNTHNDIKAFECDTCKKKFTRLSSLNEHIRNQHSNTSEKEYKCNECSYQTYRKGNLKVHLNTHNDVKPFENVIFVKSDLF